jgi:hypothetical protein
VNADLFFLLVLEQDCREGIMNLHYLSWGVQCGASSNFFTLLRLQVVLAD